MTKVIKTSKGSELPLISLKGRDYLMVAYRLQWLSDDVERYTIATTLQEVTEEHTIARAVVTIFNKEGNIMRQTQATKRETRKDFPDHTEKAETAAIGRALGMMGFGTQHALADFDEGERLADAPLQALPPKADLSKRTTTDPDKSSVTVPVQEAPKAATSFRKPPRPDIVVPVATPTTKLNF